MMSEGTISTAKRKVREQSGEEMGKVLERK